MDPVFVEFVIILTAAAVVGAVGMLLRQPLIISFIAVGLLLGPSGFGLLTETAEIRLLAEVGISLLLFVVGLKLDVANVRTMGPVALATGMGQVIFTSFFGFLIAMAMGMDALTAAYVSVALALSSTIVIIKLFTDKGEIDSLHGRITVGILIVQDIVVIAALIVLAAVGAVAEESVSLPVQLALVALKAAGLIIGIIALIRWVMKPLMDYLSRSQELLVLCAIAWAVFLATVAHLLGLSTEVGAFLAGVALASTEYREAIAARLVSLRDFLLLFFFVDLGASLDTSLVSAQASSAALLSLFVLIGNPLIVMGIMGIMGYRSRTSFFTGTAMAQISEFSLIILAMGVSLGHITSEILGLTTLVGLVTIGISSYLIVYSGPLYDRLSRVLSLFERRHPFREIAHGADVDAHVDAIVLGLGRFGGAVARGLQMRQRSVLGVDFDPDTLAKWRRRSLSAVYGDISDPEFLRDLPLNRAAIVVCTVPGLDTNLTILRLLDQERYQGRVAVMAQNGTEADIPQAASADLVLEPYIYAAEHAAEAVIAGMHHLPQRRDLPLDVAEVGLPAGSALAGLHLREIPLRAETGASVIAISRAGKVVFDPGPDFQLFPGDHLILMGCQDDLRQSREFLERRQFEGQSELAEFIIHEVLLDEASSLVGRSLAEMNFRSRYGATVIGIERGEDEFVTPDPREPLQVGDRLFIAGPREMIADLAL